MNNNPPRKRDYPLWWLLLGFSRLPFPVLYLFSDFLYLILYRLAGYRKKVVAANLANSFPEKTEAERSKLVPLFYKNLCDVIVETVKLASIGPEEMQRRAHFPDLPLLRQYVDAGMPVIVLGAHLANWEWALGAGAVSFGFPVDGVYKPLSNAFFEWFMLRSRSRLGAHLFKMKDTMRDMVKRKGISRAISFLSDQTPPRGEIQYWTTFLNQETPFFVGGDKLAASFKYPVLFMGTKRVKRGFYEYNFEFIYDGKTELPKNEHSITEAYARKLERCIRENPADYLWSHKRWKHKRPVEQDLKNIPA
jgi:KDO2-lipid IV(A) lauroyltransferase